MGKALAGKPIQAAGRSWSRCGRSCDAQRRLADEKEHQLQRYAADLRDTFVAERERAEELRASYVATVRALTNAVEARDAYTGKHAERVAAYGLELAAPDRSRAGRQPAGRVRLPAARRRQGRDPRRRAPQGHGPRRGGAEPDAPPPGDRLRDRERHRVPRGGGADRAPPPRALRRRAATPTASPGEEIPLAARIFSVADALDAMTTDRPYRPGLAARPRRGPRSAPAPAPSSTPRWSSSWTRSPDDVHRAHPRRDRIALRTCRAC